MTTTYELPEPGAQIQVGPWECILVRADSSASARPLGCGGTALVWDVAHRVGHASRVWARVTIYLTGREDWRAICERMISESMSDCTGHTGDNS